MAAGGDDKADKLKEYENKLLALGTSEALKKALTGEGCDRTCNVNEYEVVDYFGEGFLGRVYEAKKDGKVYAIKQYFKRQLHLQRHAELAVSEKNFIFALCSSSCRQTVHLYGTWKDAVSIYYILEAAAFGDVGTLQHRLPPKRFTELRTRQIVRQIVIGIEFIHACNIIHADMARRNILVFEHGRVKITDFGLAVPGRQFKYGQTGVFSKAVVTCEALTDSVDWHGLGVIMEEMLQAIDVPNKKIKHEAPTAPSQDALELIDMLKSDDLVQQIGNGMKGSREVKGHAWFKETNWYDVIFGEEQFEFEEAEVGDPIVTDKEKPKPHPFEKNAPHVDDADNEVFKEF